MPEHPLRSDRHMTDFESLMWTLEKDPHLTSGFANITLLDQPADLERLRANLRRGAAIIPQFRRRAIPSLGRLAPPRWGDDPDFDITFHVRRTQLPEPGTLAELRALAVEFCHRPYDRSRPLWQFLVVDGLADGRGAVLQRMHHTITDGVGGVRMSEQFIDVERDPKPPAAVPEPDKFEVDASVWSAVTDSVSHNVRRHIGATTRVAGSAVSMVRHPTRVHEAVRSSAGLTRALVHEATSVDHRRSPLWTQRSLDWDLHLLRIPLDDVRSIARKHGVSTNDVFVAGAAGGAGAYHRACGRPVNELRMAMPVSTRADRSAGGNAFGMARLLVPVDADPLVRLGSIHDRLNGIRSAPALALVQRLSGVANMLPTPVLVRTTRVQVETVDFTTSNVRGAPFPLFLAGARILSNHPIGPLMGTAFNLTTISYDGSLDMGLHVDKGAVADSDLLAACIQAAFEELLTT